MLTKVKILYQPAATRGSPNNHRLYVHGNIKASGILQNSVLVQFDFQDFLGLVGKSEVVQVHTAFLCELPSLSRLWIFLHRVWLYCLNIYSLLSFVRLRSPPWLGSLVLSHLAHSGGISTDYAAKWDIPHNCVFSASSPYSFWCLANNFNLVPLALSQSFILWACDIKSPSLKRRLTSESWKMSNRKVLGDFPDSPVVKTVLPPQGTQICTWSGN